MINLLALVVGFTLGVITQYVSQYRTPCGNNTIRHKLAHITGTNYRSICGLAVGKLLAEGLAEGLRKGSGDMALKEMPKVGDEIRYVGEEFDFLTVGKTYEVVNATSDVFYYYDDLGEYTGDVRIEFGDWELVTESEDVVNSPQHYKRGKYETIEVIEHMTHGYDDPFVAYCVGNTVKYADRAPFKHDSPATDLRKAAWYLTRAADYLDGKTAEGRSN